jgi:hypothetical protein
VRAQSVLQSLFFASAAVATSLAFVAPALAEEPTVSISGAVANGRIFADQGFTLTDEPVVELDLTVCKEDTCVNLWTAQSLVGRSEDHETDVAIWRDFGSDKFIFQVKVAYFEVPGKDIWEGQLTGTYQVTNNCSVALSYEQMAGGYEEKVLKAKAPCSVNLRDGWTMSIAPAIAHSEASPGTTGGLELDFSRALDNGVTIRFYGKGYARDDASDGILGIQLSADF